MTYLTVNLNLLGIVINVDRTMSALLMSKMSVSDTVESAKIKSNSDSSIRAIGVFSNHRDAKVALQELKEAGFPCQWMALFARSSQRYSWHPNLMVHNCFDATAFKCDRHSQAFLQRLFQRGKFLLLVTGNVRDIDSAGKIISRRPNYAKFWHL